MLPAGPTVSLKNRLTGGDCKNIYGDHVHSIAHALVPAGDRIFQDDNTPIDRAGNVQLRYKNEITPLPWSPYSPDLKHYRTTLICVETPRNVPPSILLSQDIAAVAV